MRELSRWKRRLCAVVLLAVFVSPAYALKERDVDPADTAPATSPAPTAPVKTLPGAPKISPLEPKGAPASAPACPGGRFTDANCQCAQGTVRKYMGNNQYECARVVDASQAEPCPGGRFNADQAPDCVCAAGATKTYMGNNQYLCSATAGKACPVEGVFTVSGNQGCKCPADMRFVPQPGNQTADCECTAADKKKWTDYKKGTYCRDRLQCPVDRDFIASTEFAKFCDCPPGHVRTRATTRRDKCQKSEGPVTCPVGVWIDAHGPLLECTCPSDATRIARPREWLCQAPSLGPVPCPIGNIFGISKYDALRDCQCPAGYNKEYDKTGIASWCRPPKN